MDNVEMDAFVKCLRLMVGTNAHSMVDAGSSQGGRPAAYCQGKIDAYMMVLGMLGRGLVDVQSMPKRNNIFEVA